jgi:hypothetical protein
MRRSRLELIQRPLTVQATHNRKMCHFFWRVLTDSLECTDFSEQDRAGPGQNPIGNWKWASVNKSKAKAIIQTEF